MPAAAGPKAVIWLLEKRKVLPWLNSRLDAKIPTANRFSAMATIVDDVTLNVLEAPMVIPFKKMGVMALSMAMADTVCENEEPVIAIELDAGKRPPITNTLVVNTQFDIEMSTGPFEAVVAVNPTMVNRPVSVTVMALIVSVIPEGDGSSKLKSNATTPVLMVTLLKVISVASWGIYAIPVPRGDIVNSVMIGAPGL